METDDTPTETETEATEAEDIPTTPDPEPPAPEAEASAETQMAEALREFADFASTAFRPVPSAPTIVVDGEYLYTLDGFTVLHTYKRVKGRGE